MSVLSYGETPLVNPWPLVHLFFFDHNTVYLHFTITCSLVRFDILFSLPYIWTALFSADREDWQPSSRWGQSNCLSVCRSAFDEDQVLEIVVGYLTVDFKVLLVGLNLGSSLRENCRSLHPTPSLGVNTNVVANYTTTQSITNLLQNPEEKEKNKPHYRKNPSPWQTWKGYGSNMHTDMFNQLLPMFQWIRLILFLKSQTMLSLAKFFK